MFLVDVSETRPVGVSLHESVENIKRMSKLSIEERIRHISRNIEVRRSVELLANQPKDSSISKNLVKEATQLLTKKEFPKSLEALNFAMQLVENDDKETKGWIAGLRSAASLHMDFFKETILDCNLALDDLPLDLTVQRFKVWGRLAISTSRLEDHTSLVTILRKIKKELYESSLEKDKVVSLLHRLSISLRSTDGNNQPTTERNKACPPKPDKCVEVKVGPAGRHVIATRDIQAGECILVDESIEAVLNLPFLRLNCTNCLRAVISGVPCTLCTQVIFCSDECMENCGFHRLECGHLDLYPPIGPLVPVLRLFTNRSATYFLENKEKFELHDESIGWEVEDDMSSVFNLQWREKNAEYIVQMSTQAFYIVHCLKTMGYFGDQTDQTGDEELYFGRLAYHFLLGADENSHQIVQYNTPGSAFTGTFDTLYEGEDDVITVIGSALTKYMSLFNNSCDVNTLKYHQGTRTVLCAKRRIKKGEEVTDFYGEHFFTTPRASRSINLGFTCLCTACRENWGLMDFLPTFSEQYQKSKKKSWAKERRHLDTCIRRMDVVGVMDSCRKLEKLVGVEPPHQELILPEMYLNYSMCYLYGNKSVQFEYFSKQINNHPVQTQ